ncbi:beta-Ig-H3/fasciclin [Coraliomargarita akajimensis DSM 45221]|uniref:Beta-Ig-H3/fasciclin n=2 Tax=Coraliomargarita TaxID=442430 RepID=D5EK53_CORAD|nr:beta-Ig-H3/fasciclin [Coraliomargarita akajimensis DSM 45221]
MARIADEEISTRMIARIPTKHSCKAHAPPPINESFNPIKKDTMISKLIILAAAIAALPIAAHAGGCGSCGSHSSKSVAKKSDIVDTAVAAGQFKTLVAAVQAADLVDTLKGDGPYTVFAPTDEAFASLPDGTVESLLKPENKDKLVAILAYHVVPAKVMAKDVKPMEAPTVNGQTATIQIADGRVMIEGATVVATDIESSNGVIHVIDKVILPAS